MNNLNHENIARLAAKRAISEISICTSVSIKDREILFQELSKISDEISGLDIKDKDNWLPFINYTIGAKWD